MRESLRLNPAQPSALATLSACHYNRQRWAEALSAAEAGLAYDPNDSDCLRLRSISLAKLGRRDEAREVSRHALAEHPENALLWSIRGWQLLRARDHRGALDAFRASLRLDPQYESAREGIVTSLKAQYRVYRWLFSYYVWMAAWSPRTQASLIVAQMVAVIVIAITSVNVRALQPFSGVLIAACIALVLLSWIADPLFYLFLRLNRFGRLALDRNAIAESNWVAGCLLVALAALVTWPLTGNDASPVVAFFAVMLIVPISVTFMANGPRRFKLGLVTAGLAALGIGYAYTAFAGNLPPRLRPGRGLADQIVGFAWLAYLYMMIFVPAVLSRSTRRV